MPKKPTPVLRCSFCHKSQSDVKKIVSSPQSDPRSYICNECITVCAAILEDDANSAAYDSPIRGRVVWGEQPAPVELLQRVERWIKQEASGRDASIELDQLRAAAKRMFVADF